MDFSMILLVFGFIFLGWTIYAFWTKTQKIRYTSRYGCGEEVAYVRPCPKNFFSVYFETLKPIYIHLTEAHKENLDTYLLWLGIFLAFFLVLGVIFW